MNVIVNNSKLYVEGLNREQLFKLYNKLRVDLLDSNIIHYRPIAFFIGGNKTSSVSNNIEKITGIGYSLAEISFILGEIITNEKKGIMDTKLQSSASETKLNSDCSFMTLQGHDIGTKNDMSMFYSGLGASEVPKLLQTDLNLFSNLKDKIAINLVLMRGRGVRDFNENWNMVYSANYIPIRTYYSLYDIFVVRRFDVQTDDYIALHYNTGVNEEVLTSILSDYINSEEVQNCLK